jgi:hypothetical protein
MILNVIATQPSPGDKSLILAHNLSGQHGGGHEPPADVVVAFSDVRRLVPPRSAGVRIAGGTPIRANRKE